MKAEGKILINRRRLLAGLTLAGAHLSGVGKSMAQTRPNGHAGPTIDVKKLGAFGNGKLPDLRQLRAAIAAAAEHPGGATVYFPPGEYFLGAADDSHLLMATNLQNIRFVGDRATLSCKSVDGSSSILALAGCRNVTIEGLAFRDYGFDRERVMGAAAIRLTNDGTTGCETIQVKDCNFESVIAGVVCRTFDEARLARIRGITLTNLAVSRSLYGFNFQDAGDNVVGRGLRCNDVKRSYFPYGVSNHNIELDTSNNATGFTDVLIKCYNKDTVGLRVKVKCRAKRSGDAIVALDQQVDRNEGAIRNISLDIDIDDADCHLDAAILIRSFDRNRRTESVTNRRWDAISIDGDIRICDKTKLFDIETASRTPGTLQIGPRLARHPRLPRTFPGFNVSVVKA